jgi:hypothetical protein
VVGGTVMWGRSDEAVHGARFHSQRKRPP